MDTLQNILFIDVETVSQHPSIKVLNDHGRYLWQQKIGFLQRREEREWTEEDYDQSYKDRAAIYAEFGKVIVISAGFFTQAEDYTYNLRIKSFYGHDEAEVLSSFVAVLDKKFDDPNLHVLCGHNIREFDIPYLCRRLTIHGLHLPVLFKLSGKKPWEVKFVLDTLEMWKYGDYKNFTSLDLLAYSLGIPSPKENMDGSKVGHCYWIESDLEKIRRYCETDVITVAQVYLRMQNMPLLNESNIILTN